MMRSYLPRPTCKCALKSESPGVGMRVSTLFFGSWRSHAALSVTIPFAQVTDLGLASVLLYYFNSLFLHTCSVAEGDMKKNEHAMHFTGQRQAGELVTDGWSRDAAPRVSPDRAPARLCGEARAWDPCVLTW